MSTYGKTHETQAITQTQRNTHIWFIGKVSPGWRVLKRIVFSYSATAVITVMWRQRLCKCELQSCSVSFRCDSAGPTHVCVSVKMREKMSVSKSRQIESL